MLAIKTIVTKQCLRFCKLLFVCVSLIQTHHIFAQEYSCANEIFQSIQLKDTAFIRQLTAISNNTSNNKPTASILEIPIVVHVLHLGEPIGTGSNIADQVIYDAVRGANERWRKLNTTEGVDMEVQFCLAHTDPNGNATNGIVRINASSVPLYRDKGMGYSAEILNGNFGADELQTKNLSNWRHNFVYNIWVVHKIVGDWGGYAYFPLPNGLDAIDGAVLSANSMRYNSSTLAHELGHAMGLFHTFQGSENGCPANDLCFIQGDWICDTPPHKIADCQNSVCNNSADSLFS
ncbi:MAG TPA: M43 family zinc metalloprotease, partial [Chitinophagales bacterium]|nr:M43 family zinc metalloprotease [Chitinophagales bacterium]